MSIVDGRIAAVLPSGSPSAGGALELDLGGYVLLPSGVEPHAHLDKALTADRVPNPAGDLAGAVAAWRVVRGSMSVADTTDRARRTALRFAAHGTGAIRTHVDVGADVGARGIEALAAVRADLAGIVGIQVVAMSARPLTGPGGAGNRAALADAVALGPDLIGGAPWLGDTRAEMDALAAVAAEAGLPLDLHLDETLDAGVLCLPYLAELVERGFPHQVTASHCVSLGVQPLTVRREVAARVAAAGIGITTNPATNLYLQGRDHDTSPPRALTPIRELLAAGVAVAGGGDNVRDPFNPVGRADPLQTASLLVTAGHLSVDEAVALVTDGGRRVLGLPPVAVRAGSPADLVAVRADSIGDAVAFSSDDRIVFRAGKLVVRTGVTTTWA